MQKILLPLLLLFANLCFAQVDLNLGLRAHYPFSGNANDISGNNNNPVFNNATLTADRFGNPNSAYHFNGTSSYMRIPNSASLNTTNQISLVAWVKPQGFYAGTCHGNSILMKGDADYLTGNYLLRYDDNAYTNGSNCSQAVDVLHQNFYGAGVVAPPPGYTPYIQVNQWHSVIVTNDGTTSRLYINCQLKVSAPQGSATFTNAFDLFIGRLNSASFPYWVNGDIDDVRIYNRALTMDEINVLGGCASLPEISNIINTYTPVLSLDLCDNKLAVDDASTFNAGDTVLIIQMKGAVIDSTNTAAFGTITDYKNAGNYEYNYIKSKAGNVLELRNQLTRQYDIPAGKVQLVRVPYYSSVNVNANLTCLPWDGSKGGILALHVQNNLTLNADIDVSGRGFRGSQPITNIPPAGIYNQTDYAYPANTTEGSRKGEGIAVVSENLIFCRGPLASGGGGGNSSNAGGGGGGNGGAGGRGGNEWGGSATVLTNGGVGGKSYAYSGAGNKIFMGGAGGAGQANDGTGTAGGNGGGIVMITANSINHNGRRIIANGAQGVDCLNVSVCADGVGGGGAGGTIVINAQSISNNCQVQANGGKGADNNIGGGNPHGPGGGGGGGSLLVNSAGLLGIITYSSTGGVAGRALNQGSTNWGAINGNAGIAASGFSIPLSAVPFRKNIDSARIKDSIISCKNVDFKGLAYINTAPIAGWQWYFGDGGQATTQNTTHTYLNAASYTVKLVVNDINGCKDSITKVVTVQDFAADAGNNVSICNTTLPVSVQLNASAGATYAWTPAALLNNPSIQNPVATISANTKFYVTISNAAGCTATDSVLITLASGPANTRYPVLNGFPYQQLQLQARNIGGTSFQWMPNIGLNNNSIANPIFFYSQSQEYTVRINTAAGCIIVDTQQVLIKGTKGIYVPRGFSPNGDGSNDRLYPILVGIKQLNYFKIYNRWGNLVFETTSGRPEDGWDGTFKGKKQPVETYTWVVEGVDIDNIVIRKNGNTLLIH